MKLNAIEKALMNNPVRAAIQRYFEAPRFRALGGTVPGGKVLEIGCGRGVGTQIIFEVFGVDQVDAIDLDPDMVRRARRRLAGYGDRLTVREGDVCSIDAPDSHYNAVFDFGIVHHVPNWRDALREVHRVLRPGGRFFAEEVLAKFIHHPLWSRILDHPMEDRFDRAMFAQALRDVGFDVRAERELWGDFAWFVAAKPAA